MSSKTSENFDPQGQYQPEYTALTKGRHLFYVTQARLRKSKKGQPMIEVRLECIGDDPCEGAWLREYFILERSWYAKLATFCRALNPDMRGRAQDAEEGFDPERQESVHAHLLGYPLAVDVVLKEETYQGEKRQRAEVERNRADGFHYWPLTEAEQDALTRQYAGADGDELTPPLPEDAYDLYDADRAGNGGGKKKGGGFSDDVIPF